jgi:predicted nucleic acid-binding Zn ribbon protein
MADILPEHDHCVVCDDPVDVGKVYCSDICKEKREKEAKKQKNKNLLFFAAVGVLFVVLTLGAYFLR